MGALCEAERAGLRGRSARPGDRGVGERSVEALGRFEAGREQSVGSGGTCRFAEFFELDTGMITGLQLQFDPKR